MLSAQRDEHVDHTREEIINDVSSSKTSRSLFASDDSCGCICRFEQFIKFNEVNLESKAILWFQWLEQVTCNDFVEAICKGFSDHMHMKKCWRVQPIFVKGVWLKAYKEKFEELAGWLDYRKHSLLVVL